MILLVSFVSSVVSVVTATIASAFGPSLALTGSDSKTILYGKRSQPTTALLPLAIRQMQFIQEYVFVLGGISVVTMVASLAIFRFSNFSLSFFYDQLFSFATFTLGPAIMTTIFCIVGTILLISESVTLTSSLTSSLRL